MPGRINVPTVLAQLWHSPDHFRLMDPLPSFHRKGIILAALVVIVCFLWPTSHPDMPESARQKIPAAPAPQPGNMQAVLVSPPQTSANKNASQPVEGIEQHWNSYRIGQGKTLAQLFRDNRLPEDDVYAMAKVEGADKPLSNLQSGQIVQIRQNVNGVVTGLAIDNGANGQVLFTRQLNGTFVRAN